MHSFIQLAMTNFETEDSSTEYLSKALEVWRMYNCYRLIFQENKNASSLDLFCLINKSYLDLFFKKSYIAQPFNSFTYLISIPK